MIKNKIQNQTGSNPAAVIKGVNSGTKMRTIEIQSKKNPAIKIISIIKPNKIQGLSCIWLINVFAVFIPPPPIKTPVNKEPASKTAMIMAVINTVFSSASYKPFQVKFL